MKIGIFGMGAVGCALYNELKDYNDLYILADEKRINKYNNEGFIINGNKYFPNTSSNLIPNLLIICVKNYHLESSLSDISKFVDENTILLPLLNGIEAHDILKSYFPNNNILYGVINVEANKIKNEVHTSKIINLQFGEEYNNPIKPYLENLSNLFKYYDVRHGIYPNMKKRVWLKWMLNMGINPISALLNASYKDMSHPEIKKILYQIFEEVYEVSKAYNIGLDDNDLDETKNRCEHFTSERVTSLTIDFYNNSQNEFEAFTPTFIRLAENKNINTPVNKVIYSLLKGLNDNKNGKDH